MSGPDCYLNEVIYNVSVLIANPDLITLCIKTHLGHIILCQCKGTFKKETYFLNMPFAKAISKAIVLGPPLCRQDSLIRGLLTVTYCISTPRLYSVYYARVYTLKHL